MSTLIDNNAYRIHNFKLAKYLCSLLKPCSSNRYLLTNFYYFVEQLNQKSPQNTVMVSQDLETLFTNIPLAETINIITNLV